MKRKKRVPEITVSLNYDYPAYSRPILEPLGMYKLFRQLFPMDEIQLRESMYAVYMSMSNRPIGWQRISVGCSAATLMNMKLVLGTAIKCNATGIVLCHNHPSGSLEFSDADKAITEKLQEAAKLFDMNLLDHILITKDGWRSMMCE
jgi:DNA repair protein RadC